MGDLQKQFEYYLANQNSLVEQYLGRYIVIVDETVVGDFNSEQQAYEFGSKTYEPGSFLIQLVNPGEESYSQTFFSRVSI